ncbi:hypothetical protein LACWKB8_1741 [Lactobacillus sp. wkB8]|nr:hypothetical protein LACWKB8_1741 [Lactobacillus sp. wkB8]
MFSLVPIMYFKKCTYCEIEQHNNKNHGNHFNENSKIKQN